LAVAGGVAVIDRRRLDAGRKHLIGDHMDADVIALDALLKLRRAVAQQR